MNSPENFKDNVTGMATSKCKGESDSSGGGDKEGGNSTFQKPPPISLLRKLLDQRYAESATKTIGLSKSGTTAAVTRPETRHHLVDLHGLTLFLRRATRCLHCYKTGSISMMGNTSRDQQPPCVTKITIKCHNCGFLLSQELKKPKSSLAGESCKPPQNSEGRVPSTSKESSPSNSPSSSPSLGANSGLQLEEVWIQEEQSDKEPPEKKRKESNDDPLKVKNGKKQTPKPIPNKALENEPIFSPAVSTTSLVEFPEPRTNIYWVPMDKVKKSIQTPAVEEKSSSSETNPELHTAPSPEAKRKSEPSKEASANLTSRKDNLTKDDKQEAREKPLCENEVNKLNKGDAANKTSQSLVNSSAPEKVKTSLTNSASLPSNLNESTTHSQDKSPLASSFIATIIEDFESITKTASPKSHHKSTGNILGFKDEKRINNDATSKFSHFAKESKDPEAKNSITIENLNVSNINFQNSIPSNYNYSPADKNNTLRDSRIIMKLLNLTETLKSELISRATEIERQNFESAQLRQQTSPVPRTKDISERVKISIKKEMEESTLSEETGQERTDSFLDDASSTGSSEIYLPKTFKSEKDSELIIPDIYVKQVMNESENFFQSESENEDAEIRGSEDKESFRPNSNIPRTPPRAFHQGNSIPYSMNIPENFSVFESDESEIDGDDKKELIASYRFQAFQSENDTNSSSMFSS